jgi:hypothetical protein
MSEARGKVTKVFITSGPGNYGVISFLLDQSDDDDPGDKFTRAEHGRPGIDGIGVVPSDIENAERMASALEGAYRSGGRVQLNWENDIGSDGYGWYPKIVSMGLI